MPYLGLVDLPWVQRIAFAHALKQILKQSGGRILRDSACFTRRQASMRDDVNMNLLCMVGAMLVIYCIKRLPPVCDWVWETQWWKTHLARWTGPFEMSTSTNAVANAKLVLSRLSCHGTASTGVITRNRICQRCSIASPPQSLKHSMLTS